ncbi:MAG: Cna B-type domain-containing protein, partial [Clostridiales bacterium]|nr:Cna B-type domain-containing protein [Clostridiales bacterium]
MKEENVFYADYDPSTYDFANSSSSNLASTVSTKDFVSMKLFDYNEMFNLYSASLERIVEATGSSYDWGENWHESGSLHDQPNATAVTHDDEHEFNDDAFTSRGNVISSSLLFRNKGKNSIAYIAEPASWNGGDPSVLQNATGLWGIESPDYTENNLLNMLFNPDSNALGVTYVGEADYLFSYDEDTGIYSYNSANNAVAYNQTEERFYVSNSTETFKNSSSNTPTGGAVSIFSPFTDLKESKTGADQVNFWFGMDMTVDFTLPDATGTVDSRNVGTDGEDLFFTISADDDVLVFVDDALVLDMSGSHVETKVNESKEAQTDLVASYEATGTIDFATGEYACYIEGNESATTKSGTLSLDAGEHTITVYYLERSGSESNFSSSFNIHNDYVPVNGTVVWDDANDQDGIRPESVTVHLKADDTEVDSATVTAEDDWSFNFSGLPKYDNNSNEIAYTITEDAVEGYETEISGDTANGFVITNSHTPKKTEVSGTITWADGNNQDGKRPNYVAVQLFAKDDGGGILDTWDFEIHAPEDPTYDNDGNEVWTWTQEDLDHYYDGGKDVKYTVIYTANLADGYEQENPNDLDTIYSYTPETTTISGSKTWVDNNKEPSVLPVRIPNILVNGA